MYDRRYINELREFYARNPSSPDELQLSAPVASEGTDAGNGGNVRSRKRSKRPPSLETEKLQNKRRKR